ncbi:META domain-containing protein [Hydrogenovibrio kuenenii]|uniref:META domain-containing protein n=1 Tax=Hydrogenovibrio kuenenii TaxID=63658 RepID=UPI00046751C5|nr:META domain-containing protein [Hydrogenovibrio kuenenii]
MTKGFVKLRLGIFKLFAGLLSLLAIVLLSACQLSPLSDSEAHSEASPVSNQSENSAKGLEKTLSSHLWQLTAFFGQNIQTTGNTNLRFSPQNKSVSGSAGCNRYFGSYTLQQNNLTFSQLGSTKMMCMDMTEEDAFFKRIGQVNHFQLKDHILTLFDRAMPLMQFTAQALPQKHQ